MNDKLEEKKMDRRMRFEVRVLVVGVIFTVTALLISIDAFKEYKSTVSILVVPKSISVSKQADAVVENIAEFPQTLSFYDYLLKSNPEIEDGYAQKSPGDRKKAWNTHLKISSGKNEQGTIIKLSVFANTAEEAETLSRLTSTALFDTVSKHYDIKTDLGISILDGPFVSAVVRGWFFIISFSIFIGFVASLALNLFLSLWDKPGKPRKYSFPKSPLAGLKNRFTRKTEEAILPVEVEVEKKEELIQDVPYFFQEDDAGKEFMEKYYPEQNVSLEKETEDFDKGAYPNFPEMPKSSAKIASAPANLPIAEDSFPLREAKEEPEQEEAPSFIELKKEEPTEEELRERLNKLLKGEM